MADTPNPEQVAEKDARIAELEKADRELQALPARWTRKPLAGLPKIVCLCGSTRFMQAFFDAGWTYTLAGYIVLSVGVCKHAEDHGTEALGPDVVERLDELHKRKIDLADLVCILNVDGYIGESTRSELDYALEHGKPVVYLEPENVAKEQSDE